MQQQSVFLQLKVGGERDKLVLQPVPCVRTLLDAVLPEAFAAAQEVVVTEEVARKSLQEALHELWAWDDNMPLLQNKV